MPGTMIVPRHFHKNIIIIIIMDIGPVSRKI